MRAFLRRTLVAEMGTLSASGRPFVTPLWFVADRGALYMTTGPGTRAGRNVVRNAEVVLLLDGGRADRMLRLRGRATCHCRLPGWRILLRIAAKYYLAPRGLARELRNARRWRLRSLYYRQAKGGFGYLRVVPTTAEILEHP